MSDKSYRRRKSHRNGESALPNYLVGSKPRPHVRRHSHDAGLSIVGGVPMKSGKVQVCDSEPRRN